jgi:asparagine synthase (glutamine-hydrolysing)
MNIDSITRILTLRYDPTKEPVIKPLGVADFAPNKYDIEKKVVEIIREDLIRKENQLKFKRLALSLSGGVDSGLTIAMLRSILPSIKLECISVGFGDKDDEVNIASEIARIYNCNFQQIILEDVLTDLPISIVKEPRWNLYHYFALEVGRKQAKIFYTGDGGDELFGGYTFRYHKFLSQLPTINMADWQERVKLYLSCHERDWVPDQDKIFSPKVKFSWQKIYGLLRPYFENGLHPLNQVFLADFNGKLLYDWLPANKAFEKSLDMKIESMFLTSKMIKFATHVPWEMKYDPDKALGKIPLRRILSRQKGFQTLDPIKKGFSVDIVSLWKKNAREIVGRYVNSNSEVVKENIIEAEWIVKTWKRLSEAQELDPRYINRMLGMLALEVWYRLFISNTMTRNQKL